MKDDRVSPWYILDRRCREHWNEQAIWSRERSYTFGELSEQVARYGQWMLDQGIRPKDLVALYLQNCPEFMMIWFACLCIGAAPAFINYNLEGPALLHCLDVCESKLLIADSEPSCRRRIEGSRAYIEEKGTTIVVLNGPLKQEISTRPAVVPGDEYRKGMQGSFPYCLIYTR